NRGGAPAEDTTTPFACFARKRRYAWTLPLTCSDATTKRHVRQSFPTSERERQRRRSRVLRCSISHRAGGGRWSQGGFGCRARERAPERPARRSCAGFYFGACAASRTRVFVRANRRSVL